MTSKMNSKMSRPYSEAYVWTWLPGHSEPVVAGLLSKNGEKLNFNYGRSYLARPDATALYEAELPLRSGAITPLPGLMMAGCIRDASPDAWGRRVLINRLIGSQQVSSSELELDELTYLLESCSDRIGALDFQSSPTQYKGRQAQQTSLEDLMTSAEKVEKGIALTTELDQALLHGTSLGGARPKVLIEDGKKKYIAKFSASNDLYSVVKAEFIAMRLAHKIGLKVAPVKLQPVLGKDVLLIERFDRIRANEHWQRLSMISALTLLELDEMMAAYASYEKLAEIIRHRFTDPKGTLRELFSRIVFNILCGNTDDHARNHAAFWDGRNLTLTPAYDLCPQARTGQQASQAMLIQGNDRNSQLATCISASIVYLLSQQEALAIVNHQVEVIESEWQDICNYASLNEVERKLFWHRQFLNPYAFQRAPQGVRIPSSLIGQ